MYFARSDFYSREAAVKYAERFALHPNPAYRYFPIKNNTGGDCANFLSQCLSAGGAPLSRNPKNQWWYNINNPSNINDDRWSVSWTVANSLFWLLKINYKSNLSGPKGLEVNIESMLQPGDAIFFEDTKGLVFHSALVSSLNGSTPLVSHHSFEALNIPVYKSYDAIKLHYLKISV